MATTMPPYNVGDHGREDAIPEKYKCTTSTGGSIRSAFSLPDQWICWGIRRGRRFLVISGFLMTGIIFKGLQAQNFSIINFYVSRARRIIPALVALCAALLIFGFIYLPLDDYRETIRSIKSSLFFSSNFMFAKTGNYFDAPLHEN